MTRRSEVLVAIINNIADFEIARGDHWYRIPVSSQEKWLEQRWPPEWLAFYQTKAFGVEQHAVRYYARVKDIQRVTRAELFPEQPPDEKSKRHYYKLTIGDLQKLLKPICSLRRRRIVFIPTTWHKLMSALEINDLSDESPLEDTLWAALKRWDIKAERQESVQIGDQFYFLDFAIYCTNGKIDVETDGDIWHLGRENADRDRPRNNDLTTVGWRVLRFNTTEINEKLETYCVKKVIQNINDLDGPEEGRVIPRHIDPDGPGNLQQMSMFDDLE